MPASVLDSSFTLDEYTAEVYRTLGGQWWWQLISKSRGVYGSFRVMRVSDSFLSSRQEAVAAARRAYSALPVVLA